MRAIAAELGRDVSTISRELKRNRDARNNSARLGLRSRRRKVLAVNEELSVRIALFVPW